MTTETTPIEIQSERERAVWQDGHEQGWNDCLHEWEEQDKVRRHITAKNAYSPKELIEWIESFFSCDPSYRTQHNNYAGAVRDFMIRHTDPLTGEEMP